MGHWQNIDSRASVRHNINMSFFFVAVALLLTVVAFTPTLTGFLTYNADSTEILIINQTYTTDSRIDLPFIVPLEYLSITGEIVGEGDARILLTDGNNTWLVYEDSLSASPSGNLLTGMVTGNAEDSSNETLEENITDDIVEEIVEKVIEEEEILEEEVLVQNGTLDVNETVENNDTNETNESEEVFVNESLEINETDNLNITIEVNDTLEVNGTIEVNETVELNQSIDFNDTNETNINESIEFNESVNLTIDLNETINETINLTDDVNETNVTENLPDQRDDYLVVEVNDTNMTVNETEVNETLEEIIEIVEEVNDTNESLEINETINFVIYEENFFMECVETCTLPNVENLSLIIELDEGVNLTLEAIHYILTYVLEQIQPIPNLELGRNQTLIVQLSDYFSLTPDLVFDTPFVTGLNAEIVDDTSLAINGDGFGIFEMFVYATDGEELLRSNLFNVTVYNETPSNVTLNETLNITLNETLNMSEIVGVVVANEPVNWKREVISNDAIVPSFATNIVMYEDDVPVDVEIESFESVKKVKLKENKIITPVENLELDKLNDKSKNESKDKTKEEKNKTEKKKVYVEFQTPGPKSLEKNKSNHKKEVMVSSYYHFENVTAYTTLPTQVPAQAINIYWVEEGRYVNDFEVFDDDGNGLIDRVGWIVPHLSNQTFEITLTILNPVEYLRDGDVWTVRFNTTGVGNLSIVSNNSYWEEVLLDDEFTVDEMEFLNFTCGESSVLDDLVVIDENESRYNYVDLLSDDSVKPVEYFIEDYTCENETGEFSNYMNIAGYAELLFTYVGQNMTVTDVAIDPTLNTVSITPTTPYIYEDLAGYCNGSASDSEPLHYEFEWNVTGTSTKKGYLYTKGSLGVSSHHRCMLLYNNSIACWGMDDDGQLGDGYDDGATETDPVIVNTTWEFSSVAIGYDYSCGVLTNGSIACWGNNSGGRLGNGESGENEHEPVLVNSSWQFTQVSCGYFHTCALAINGTIVCWGSDSQGILGDGGGSVNSLNPVPVNSTWQFKEVSTGIYHSCALLNNGSLACWGIDNEGQGCTISGSGTLYSPTLCSTEYKFISVSTEYSGRHSCALRDNGKPYCWGKGDDYRLGDGNTGDNTYPYPMTTSWEFKDITAGSSNTCGVLVNGTAVCLGSDYWGDNGDGGSIYDGDDNTFQLVDTPGTFAFVNGGVGMGTTYSLLENGTVVGWGYGLGTSPVILDYDRNISLGYYSDSITFTPPQFYTDDLSVQLPGLSSEDLEVGTITLACKVGNSTSSTSWVNTSVSAANHSAPSQESSRLSPNPLKNLDTLKGYCNGTDPEGQKITYSWELFWNDTTYNSGSISEIASGTETEVVEVSNDIVKNGGNVTLACRSADSNYYSDWLNSTELEIIFVSPTVHQATIGPSYASPDDVLIGYCNASDPNGDDVNYSYIWYEDNVSYSQGSNPTHFTHNVLTNVVNLSTGSYDYGDYMRLACLASDGTNTSVWYNGSEYFIYSYPNVTALSIYPDILVEETNPYGYCQGNDSTEDVVYYEFQWNQSGSTLTEGYMFVEGSLSSTYIHTCVLLTNGSIGCWGNNDAGQLGNGQSGTDSYEMVIVNSSFEFIAVTAGRYHTCGLLTNGSVACWGSDSYGVLGDGDDNGYNETTPVFVNSTWQFAQIAAGYEHTCGVLINGSVSCWGRDWGGMIGDGDEPGSEPNQESPILVDSNWTFSQVSAGTTHSCGILTNGSISCWGFEQDGQLGNGVSGSTTYEYSPVMVNTPYSFIYLSAGKSHACAIQTNGTLWCWGKGDSYQTGDGNTNDNPLPNKVAGNLLFKNIDAGGEHTCGVLINGSVSCWGQDAYGQIGDGDETGVDPDQQTPIFISLDSSFKTVSAGYFHSCGLLTNGSIACWGWDDDEQQANGAGSSNQYDPTITEIEPEVGVAYYPKESEYPQKYFIEDINQSITSLYYDYTSTGSLTFSCRLGDGTVNSTWSSTSLTVETNTIPVTQSSELSTYTPSNSDTLTAYCNVTDSNGHRIDYEWQWYWNESTLYEQNSSGNLTQGVLLSLDTISPSMLYYGGNWTFACRGYDGYAYSDWMNSSVAVVTVSKPNIESVNITPISPEASEELMGYCNASEPSAQDLNYSYRWYRNGELYSSGSDPTTYTHNVEINLDNISSSETVGYEEWKFGCIASSPTNTSAWSNSSLVTINPTLEIYSVNITTESPNNYVDIQGSCNASGAGNEPITIAFRWNESTTSIRTGYLMMKGGIAGGNPTRILLPNGSSYALGSDSGGGLGDGGGQSHSYDESVMVNTSWKFAQISGQGSHSCALMTNGSAACWGNAFSGQLGYGYTEESFETSPVMVNTSWEFMQVESARSGYSCGLLENGSAACWGGDSYGRLGNGANTSTQYVPDMVDSSWEFIDISTYEQHTCAVLSNYSAACWGYASDGKLGNGATSGNYVSPDLVHTSFSFVSISNGYDHTCALMTNGSIACWGADSFGQVGDGSSSQSDKSTPVMVDSSLRFKYVSAAYRYTCALTEEGIAYCWGYDSYGQLGDGDTESNNAYSPRIVDSNERFVFLDSGYQHTVALLENGTLIHWGDLDENYYTPEILDMGYVASSGYRPNAAAKKPEMVTHLGSYAVPIYPNENNTGANNVYLDCRLFNSSDSTSWSYDSIYVDQEETPVTQTPRLEPTPSTNNEDLEGYCNVTDEDTANVYLEWRWYKDNSLYSSGNTTSSYPEGVEVNVENISKEILSEGGNWTIECRGNDGYTYSNWTNSTTVTPILVAPYLKTSTISPTNAYANDTLLGYCYATDSNGDDVTYSYQWYVNNSLHSSGSSGPHTQDTDVNVNNITNANLAYGARWILACKASDGVNESIWINSSEKLIKGKPNVTSVTLYSDSYDYLDTYYANCTATDPTDDVLAYAFEWNLSGSTVREGYIYRKGSVSAGNSHTCALLVNGSVACWGRDDDGQLGDGDDDEGDEASPVLINISWNFSSVSSGHGHTCALLVNGSVACWGYDNYGQLGDGDDDEADEHNPVLVNTDWDFASVSAGRYHTCGLLTNGSVACWGRDDDGQLGDGDDDEADEHNPVLVNSSAKFISVDTSESGAVAVMENGSVAYWGNDDYADWPGNGAGVNAYSPKLLDSNLEFVTASISEKIANPCSNCNFFCGLLVNGSVACWGYNFGGYLGDGTTTNSETPVVANTTWTFVDVSVFGATPCALMNNGSVACWGTGYGTTPTMVNGSFDFVSINVGGGHRCGILKNTSISCWGTDDDEQLGDGSGTTTQDDPVLVSTTWPSALAYLPIDSKTPSRYPSAGEVVDLPSYYNPDLALGSVLNIACMVTDRYDNSTWVNASATVLTGPNYAPNTPIITLAADDNRNMTNMTLNCSTTITDDNNDDMNVSVRWYINGTINETFDYNYNWPTGSFVNSTLDSGNTTIGDNWSCSFNITDGSNHTGWISSANLTIIPPTNTTPTVPTNITCDGGKCEGNFSGTVQVNCSGSTDLEYDEITYSIEIGNGTEGGITDYTTRECNNDGSGSSTGVTCGDPTNKNEDSTDGTFDSCTDGSQNSYMHVEDITVNATTVNPGDSIKVTCNICSYSTSTEYAVAYYNGTTWVNIDYGSATGGNMGSTCTYFDDYEATITIDDYIGTHYVRCIEAYNGFSGMTCNTNTYADNDDMNITVVAGSSITWDEIGNHTENTILSWDTSTAVENETYDYIRCMAVDLEGSKNYSDYFEQDVVLNITADEENVPNTPVVTLESEEGTDRTGEDLNCSTTVSDNNSDILNVTFEWYKNGDYNRTQSFNNIESGSFLNSTLDSGNTTKEENWDCRVKANDSTTTSSGWGASTNLTILNTPPTTPNTLTPTTGIYETTISIGCSGSTDTVDGDTVSYTIQTNRTGSWVNIVSEDADGSYDWSISAFPEQDDVDLRCAGTDTEDLSGWYNPAGTLSIDNDPPVNVSQSNNSTVTLRIGDVVEFNITYTDKNLDTCFFEIDDGAGSFTNYTNESCNGGQVWSYVYTLTATRGEVVNWSWYANDSLDHFNHTYYSNFTIIDTPPTTPTSLTPTIGNYSNPVSIDCGGSTDADSDGVMYTIHSNQSGNWGAVVINDADGTYDWTITSYEQSDVDLRCIANNTYDNSTWYNPAGVILIDGISPRLLYNGTNATNNLTGDVIKYNVTFNDTFIDICIFEYYNGSEWSNTTNTSCASEEVWELTKTITALPDAIINWSWYANDTVNNWYHSNYYSFVVEIANNAPTDPSLVLNSTFGTNYTEEDLTVYITESTDLDSDEIFNITDWRVNGSSVAVINTPFDINISVTSGNIKDYSTHNNNGTLGPSGQTPTWNRSGVVGGSYYFDGNDYIDFGDLDFFSDEIFTITMWFKPSGATGDAMLYKGSDDFDREIYIAERGTARIFESGVKNNYVDVSIYGNYDDGNWHFLGLSANSTNITLKIDGANLTKEITVDVGDLSALLQLGQYNTGAIPYEGELDEFILYDEGLSLDQLQVIYEAGLAGKHLETIVSAETSVGQNWSVAVTSTDSLAESSTVESYNLTIVENPSPVLLHQNSFDNFTDAHSFNVTAGVTHVSGGSDIMNTTLNGASCSYASNTTIGNYFNVTYTCSGPPFTSDTVNISFCDSTNDCISSAFSTNYYPNQVPTMNNLLTPTNENYTLTNRNVSFTWEAASDAEGDDINYTINVTNSYCADFEEFNISTNSYNHDILLNTSYECYADGYYWQVQACDSWNCSSWSTLWNFSIADYLDITVLNDEINFSTLFPGNVDDTTDDDPSPFIFENSGNIPANLSAVSSTSLWSMANLNTSYYQFKANYSTEVGSFYVGGSSMSWLNMTATTNDQVIISNLNYTDSADVCSIDLRLEVPIGEIAEEKSATITFTWEGVE